MEVSEIRHTRTKCISFFVTKPYFIFYRMVDSHPSWGKKLEVNLAPGVHTVTFRARSPNTKAVDICRTVITVKGVFFYISETCFFLKKLTKTFYVFRIPSTWDSLLPRVDADSAQAERSNSRSILEGTDFQKSWSFKGNIQIEGNIVKCRSYDTRNAKQSSVTWLGLTMPKPDHLLLLLFLFTL